MVSFLNIGKNKRQFSSFIHNTIYKKKSRYNIDNEGTNHIT